MDEQSVHLLIRRMLQSGQLPYDHASKVVGSPAAGEVCAACGTVIADEQLVMKAMTKTAKGADPVRFHVLCFELWNDERRKAHVRIA